MADEIIKNDGTQEAEPIKETEAAADVVVIQGDKDITDLAESLKGIYENTMEAVSNVSKAVNKMVASFMNTSAGKGEIVINSILRDDVLEIFEILGESFKEAAALIRDLFELRPYIEDELKKEEYEGITFEEIINDYTAGELIDWMNEPGSLFKKALDAAREAQAAAERVTIQRTSDIEYPLDKISGRAWNLLKEDTMGQLEITFDLLPKKKNLEATAIYSINFDNLKDNVEITKRLLPFDKRVYIAVSSLYNAGNKVITATQIYFQMGNTGRPSPTQIKKICTALSKMTGAQITLNNKQEHTALKGKYPLFEYSGSLLPMERVTAIVNGQITESAIHVFREPPLMTFAKERKQVTTIDVALLQSPISKTDANLAIDDYLIDRISKAKNGKNNYFRILFKTLYERADIKTKKQKQRAPKKIETYLTHYQQKGFFKKYTMQTDGITIYF